MNQDAYLEVNASQAPAIELLKSMGYAYISPANCELQRGSRYHVLLKDILRGQLAVKNPYDYGIKSRIVRRFIDQRCKTVFAGVMDELYPFVGKYGVKRPVLKIRTLESRWGSCLVQKGVVMVNRRLLAAPRCCIEYVVLHELCHFIHPNHSVKFYALLSALMPDWKERKKLLNTAMADIGLHNG